MKENHQAVQKNNTVLFAAAGGVIVALVLIFGTLLLGQSARRSTEEAVHSVSNFYLQELAGRREQVVAANLNSSIKNMYAALGLMDETDFSDIPHLRAWQAKTKRLYELEKFAFVDKDGLIYTSAGVLDNIGEYQFDYRTISAPEISIKDLKSEDKKVVIAIPAVNLPYKGQNFIACFMEIDMDVLLEGVSIQTDVNATTFCNLYYEDGTSLTGVVLGGMSSDQSLMVSLARAEFSGGSSLEQIQEDFRQGREGLISFTYNGTSENMYYVPVKGTNWMLTYLIRDSMIEEQINTISQGIITRSLIHTVITTVILAAVFAVIVAQNRRTGRLLLEKETEDAANRVKQAEMRERLKLQDQLLEQERQNDTMRTLHDMLKSGPWYMDFDENGNMVRVTWTDTFRKMVGYDSAEDFPDRLESWSDLLHPEDKERVLREFNETIRDYTGTKVYDVTYRLKTRERGWRWFHAVGQPTRRPDGSPITYIGIFMDITDRKEMEQKLSEQQESLRDALAVAEQANAAKTSFLSSMSH